MANSGLFGDLVIGSRRQLSHEAWKSDCIDVLYGCMLWQELLWPTLTVEWLPDGEFLLVGTQYTPAETGEPSSLRLLHATLPEHAAYTQRPAMEGAPPSLQAIQEVPHGMHDVNRARAMPQQPCIVATRSDCADAFLFKLDGDAMAEALASPSGSDTEMDDAEQQQRLPHQQDSGTPAGTSATASQEAAAEFNPLHVLTGGHAAGGFGLAWNGAAEGRLVTTGEDGVACVWDVAAGSPISSSDPQAFSSSTGGALNDVAWQSNGSLFGTIGEGCRAAVWDVRCPRQPAASSSCVHVQEGTCLAFDALNDNQLATGGKDAAVCVLDVRKLQRPLMRLHVHAEAEVTRVAWSPHAAGMLASAAHDGHVLLWDTRAAYDSAAAALEAPGWGGGGGAGPAAAASGAAPAAGGGGGRRKQQQPKRREPGMLAQMGLAGYSDAPKVAELLEAPPDGLLFLHAGHIGAVADVAWHPKRPWLLASASIDTVVGAAGQERDTPLVQVWEMQPEIVRGTRFEGL